MQSEVSDMAKAKDKTVGEDKIQRHLLRLMPELPDLLEKVCAKAERFDGTEPKTFLASVEADVNGLVAKLYQRKRRLGRFWAFLIGRVVARAQARVFASELIEMTKQAAAVDSRYSLLLKLMHKTDEKVPFASLIVSFRHGDPKEAMIPQCAPLSLFRQAEETTGEARATLVLDALAKTVEFLYKPYVLTIWILSYVKEGKHPPQPPEFGDLVKVTHERLLDYAGLVEPRAGWMRNSAVHNVLDYILEEDSVWMWDRKGDREKIRVDELLAMAQSMYSISARTIQRVGQLYMFREFFLQSGLLDMMLDLMPHALANDQEKAALAEQEISSYGAALLEPLEKFCQS